MLDFSQMIANLVVALGLGALMGLERELVGKAAGVRTAMMVSGGAAMFTMIAMELPHLIANSPEITNAILADNAGYLNVIANIVVGIGFLGAGIILKDEEHEHVRGLTTAAVVWATAAVGVAVGVGLTEFAIAAAVLISGTLYALRTFNVGSDHGHHGRR
jgi:putative Mg2+ transporter-C (MgtC) family protein